jgi:hypothetical protein
MAPPPALGTCVRGNELFSAGAWENLLGCLELIPASQQEACDEPAAGDNVLACVDKMYAEACVQDSVVTECDTIKTECDNAGQLGFDVAGCKADLNPFGAGGIAEYEDCYTNSDPSITCAGIHDHCIGVLFQ